MLYYVTSTHISQLLCLDSTQVLFFTKMKILGIICGKLSETSSCPEMGDVPGKEVMYMPNYGNAVYCILLGTKSDKCTFQSYYFVTYTIVIHLPYLYLKLHLLFGARIVYCKSYSITPSRIFGQNIEKKPSSPPPLLLRDSNYKFRNLRELRLIFLRKWLDE